MANMPDLKNMKLHVQHLSKSLKRVHQEQKEQEQPMNPTVQYEDVQPTWKERGATLLKYFMTACTTVVGIQIAVFFYFPQVFDLAYESMHSNDFSEAEVFLSNQYPHLVPLLKASKDSNAKCKGGKNRSCHLFLEEDYSLLLQGLQNKDVAYGRSKEIRL